ncbi:hypothetical protein [Thalassobacillus sp. CUG 92003]|uniref:hypothetical protein n=1 Tax=Thalassobacillus sp. CUG 92003 TaxID=2736641 RepID=UPI0015E78451|nr:hypothetical protein [Thalassobacillus sp. CUG 92003]
MKAPHQKWQQLQVLSLAVVILFSIVALFQLDHAWLILLLFYSIAVSLMFDALMAQKKQQPVEFFGQLLRAIIVIIFSTTLFFL